MAKRIVRAKKNAGGRNKVPPKPRRVVSETKHKYPKKASKRKAEKDEAVEEFGDDPQDADLNSSDEVETLLLIENRKSLPLPDAADKKLSDLIADRPKDYQGFIALLRDGASLVPAATAWNIGSPTQVNLWYEKGGLDYHRDVDSYYSRFFIDITRVIAHTTSEKEIKVVTDAPLKYLTHGMGRTFGNQWQDAPQKKTVVHQHEGNVNHLLHPPEAVQASEDELDIEEGELLDAMQELERANVIQLGPDWEHALKIQSGNVTAEEMEELVKDQEENTEHVGTDGVLRLSSEGMPLLTDQRDAS